jgi:drug/metabolite transporter (DMT)-like permease
VNGAATGATRRAGPWLALMPALFVLIWSTGFVVARYGMPHAPPFGFLALRFALSIACFGLWIALARVPLPRVRVTWRHLAVSGVLMHAGYLGGVWAAVKLGIGAGTIARVQWLGLALGVAGLTLVVGPRLGAGEVTAANLVLALLALLSITAGTLYQKRHPVVCDVRAASLVQLLASLLVTLPLALLETEPMRWHPELVGALAWSVLVLTLGGSSLLYLLIQRGAATAVTSLLYLVPPCTALMAWALFGEALGASVLAGLALSAVGVWLVLRPPPAR